MALEGNPEAVCQITPEQEIFLVSLSGVLRIVNNALDSLAVSSVPDCPMLSLRSRFTCLTVSSAQQFACGFATDVIL